MATSLIRIFLGLSLFGAMAISCAAAGSDPVDLRLKTAMAMAIRNNLDLRVDALDSSITAASMQQSRGIYDPFLSVTAGHDESFYSGENYGTKSNTASVGVTQYLPSGGNLTAFTSVSNATPLADPDYDWTDWYSSVGITFTQPLLKNFGKQATELGISLALNEHQASIEQYRETLVGTVYDVIRGYNRLYTLRMIQRAREAALASAQQLLTTIKQNKNGEQQSVELANTRYSISRRLKDLVDAERNTRDQEAKLLYLIGVKERIKLNPVDLPSTEEPKETTEQAIVLAMENGFYLKQLRLDLRSSELQEQVSKGRQLPNLSLNTSVGFRGVDDRFNDSFQQIADGKGRWWSAGLQFSVPLGNTVAKGAYRRDRLRTQQVRNRIAATEWKLRDTIETDMRALMSARVQRQVAERSVKLSEQRFEQYRQSVARKTSKIQDLLNAENDLVYAGIAEAEAMESFSNAVALLWRDAGVLLERKDIHVNTEQPEELTIGALGFSSQPFVAQNMDILAPEIEAAPLIVPLDPLAERRQSISSPVVTPEPPGVRNSVSTDGPVEKALYTLRIGEYVSSELAATRGRLKKAGLVPLVTPGTEQPRTVIRLNAGDYQDPHLAKIRLRRLLKLNAGGFMLKRGKAGYRVYAGSYFSRGSAIREQRRLERLGVTLSLDEVSVLLPTSLLSAGSFVNREAALAEAVKLERLGVKSVVQKKG